MRTKKRKLLCVGAVALLLLGLVGSGVAVSSQAHSGDDSRSNGLALGKGQQEQVEQQTQSAGKNKTIQVQQKEKVKAMNNGSNELAPGQVKKEIPQLAAIKVPITVLHKAQGFALNESTDESHVLTTSIIRVRRVQPMHMRDLMEANKSIEDIKAEITEADWVPYYKGSIRLGEYSYNMVNISVNETGDDLTFSADLVDPLVDSEPITTAGTITITAPNYEDIRIGDGTLTINEGVYSGEYRVLLIVHPIRALVKNHRN